MDVLRSFSSLSSRIEADERWRYILKKYFGRRVNLTVMLWVEYRQLKRQKKDLGPGPVYLARPWAPEWPALRCRSRGRLSVFCPYPETDSRLFEPSQWRGKRHKCRI